MGGNATFAGTTFQARVIAYIYAHVLTQSPLGWFVPQDDTPLAVSGETDGPGDDARIEFGSRHPAIEVQAKHGLTGGGKLQEVFQRITEQSEVGDSTAVVLAVDREGSSRKVYRTFADDLERMRSGRTDALSKDTIEMLEVFDANGYDRALLLRVRVVAMDIDRESHPEAKFALQLLRSIIEDAEQVAAAWALLVEDAGDICARRLRRTRKDLVDRLGGAGIRLQPLAEDAPWHRQLDFSRSLLERHHPTAALSVLSQLETRLQQLPPGTRVDPRIRYRLAQHRASALLQIGRGTEALVSAREALDVDPNGSHALTAAIFAATFIGDFTQAEEFTARAVSAHPDNADIWRAKARLAVSRGVPLPTPPAAVAESTEFRTILAQLAMETAEWEEALQVTGELLADGVRTADVLFVRVNALMSLVRTPARTEDVARARDAERLATELTETLEETHPYTVKAFVLRSASRRVLDRDEEADADLALARELKSDDHDALRHAALARMQSGDFNGALEVLRHPAVEGSPELLVMRAHLLALEKDEAASRRDLDLCLGQLAEDEASDAVRLDAVDVALSLRDIQLAGVILDAVVSSVTQEASYAFARGQLEFQRGNYDEAVSAYAEAGRRDETLRPMYLSDLGFRFLQAKKPADAVRAFGQVDEDRLPPGALRFYAAALFEANELPKLKELIDSIAAKQALPDWALAVATDVALRQEDVDVAIAHLGALVDRGATEPREHLRLARLLLERGRIDDARGHVDTLLEEAGLSASGRMDLAQLLGQLGREEEALSVALRAFRDQSHDPRFHRALVALAISGSGAATAVTHSGPDTHIRLRSADGSIREHTIYSDLSIDPLRGEMSVTDAEAAGLLGKTAGDTVVRHAGTWQEQVWTVEEVLPAVIHVVREIIAHYEERFPSEPFFVTRFKIGKLDTVRSWAPIVGSLESGREMHSEVLALYREHQAPLGMIAKMLHVTIADVMEWISTVPSLAGPLMIEWSDINGQMRGRQAVLADRELVLTRSALHLAGELDLLDLLKEHSVLLAPRSLADDLDRELRDAEQQVLRGHTSMATDNGRLVVTKLDPGDAWLVRKRDRLRELVDWLRVSAQITTRPLETIPAVGSKEEEMREYLGRESSDAVALANHRGAVLYADDIGLRRFVSADDPHGSLSTISLLHGLVERGVMTPADRDRRLLALVAKNAHFILPSKKLLQTALRHSGDLGREGVARVFALLATPSFTAFAAARMVVEVVKAQVSAPIQVASTSEIVSFGLDAMSAGWPTQVCIQAMGQASEELLVLLPQIVQEVLDACKEFAVRSLPNLGGVQGGR